MSTSGIIAILLTVIGILIVSWVGIASMWIKDKFTDHEVILDDHDDRIIELESNNQKANGQREEMLDILRKQGGV